jgi:hypothetical protein
MEERKPKPEPIKVHVRQLSDPDDKRVIKVHVRQLSNPDDKRVIKVHVKAAQ